MPRPEILLHFEAIGLGFRNGGVYNFGSDRDLSLRSEVSPLKSCKQLESPEGHPQDTGRVDYLFQEFFRLLLLAGAAHRSGAPNDHRYKFAESDA